MKVDVLQEIRTFLISYYHSDKICLLTCLYFANACGGICPRLKNSWKAAIALS